MSRRGWRGWHGSAKLTREVGLALLVAALFPAGCTTAAREAPFAADPAAPLEARARRLLESVPLIDGHNDIPWRYRERFDLSLERVGFDSDLSGLEPPLHTDLGRLRAGGVGAQFWSVYVPAVTAGGEPGGARLLLEQIDFVHRMVGRYPDHLAPARTAADVERVFRSGRIACLIGMEGGHCLQNSLAVLRAAHELGAGYLTLTHTKNNDWADSATDEPLHGGLTDFGREVVREMNRLGMLVDLSHVSPATMHDGLDVARAPVIFSHSGAYAVCRHVRNVPDDVLLRVRENRGVVMVVFLGTYVSEELRLWDERRNREEALRREAAGGDEAAVQARLADWDRVNPAPRATVAQVADHIDHIRSVAGIDHIGIGSDFDGTTSLPVGLEDVSQFPNLVVELLRRGYTDGEVRKILGLNVLRVMREAERVAAGG